jgi:hypothetical protein
MKLIANMHPVDSDMVEIYFRSTWNSKRLLACVMHIDCFNDSLITEALSDGEVELDVVMVRSDD